MRSTRFSLAFIFYLIASTVMFAQAGKIDPKKDLKLDGDPTHFINGVGDLATPAGSLTSSNGVVDTAGGTYNTVCGRVLEERFAGTTTINFPTGVLGCKGTISRGVSAGVLTIAPPFGVAYDGTTTQLPQGQSIGWWYDGTGYHSTRPLIPGSHAVYTPGLTGNILDFVGTGGTSSIALPITTYTAGAGVVVLGDSTSIGGVLNGTGPPANGTGSLECPGTSNANWGQVYQRTDVTPYTYYDCSKTTSTWQGPELPFGSMVSRIFSVFNQQSTKTSITSDYPYPATHYSNTSGIINTGNSPCFQVFSAELFPWEIPNGDSSVTYINHCGVADYLSWVGTIGFGTETNAPATIAGTVTAAIAFEGSPKFGFIPAQASTVTTSGTWTALNPTTVSTTGTASTGSTALTVASGSGIAAYYRVVDVTNPASIAYGTYVATTPSGTSVTLSQNTVAAISGDTLNFINPQSAPFVSGYAKCATGSGTLTFTTPAASGGIYLIYLVDGTPGTAAATYSVDSGASTGSLSSGDGGTFSSAVSKAWWGKRLPVSGTGAHTVAVTVTSGQFCPIGLSTPTPSMFDALNPLPRVVQELIAPAGDGYNSNDLQVKTAVSAVVTQMAADGYNVVAADPWASWPEASGGTSYFEHHTGTYGNNLVCAYDASPHFNDCGNAFNANAEVTASGASRSKVFAGPSGLITVNNAVPGKQIVDVNSANLDILNQANSHSTGNQVTKTGSITTVGTAVQGAVAGSSTPGITSSGDLPAQWEPISGSFRICSASVTVALGDKVLVTGIPKNLSATLNVPIGTRGEVYSQIATFTTGGDDTYMWLSTATTSAGSDTITSGSSGHDCGAGTYVSMTNSPTLDSSPVTARISPTTFPGAWVVGPITTTASNDLLIASYESNHVDGCNFPITISGYTTRGSSAYDGRIQTGSVVSTTPGNYSASVTVGGTPCSSGLILAAFVGAGTPQSADLHQFLPNSTTPNSITSGQGNVAVWSGFKWNGQYYSNDPTCISGSFTKGDGTGCGTPTGTAPTASNVSAAMYSTSTNSGDAYSVTLSPAVAAYTDGLTVRFLPSANNTTTTPTLNVNSLGAGTIVKQNNGAVVASDLVTTNVAVVVRKGTTWQLQNPQVISGGSSYPAAVVVTASGASATAVTGCITSSYRDYEIRISGGSLSAGSAGLQLYYSTNNGSTYDTTNANYVGGAHYSGVTTSGEGRLGGNSNITYLGIWPNPLYPVDIVGNMNFPMNSGSAHYFFGHETIKQNSDSNIYDIVFTHLYQPGTAVAVNAFEIVPTSGTWSGVVTCQPKP